MLTRDEVLRVLDYDPVTGVFRWNTSPANCVKVGSVAGTVTVTGRGKQYCYIQIRGRKYYSHRLALLIQNGKFPDDEIDHVDGNGTNNAAANLREVTRKENCKNKRKQVNNKSGVGGVAWHKAHAKWHARICLNGKDKHLGYFENFAEAVAVRKNAEKSNDYHINHGSDRNL